MSRKLRLHRQTIRQLTKPDATQAVGGMIPPARAWGTLTPALTGYIIQASIDMCTAWGVCITGQCTDGCGPDTSPVTACACMNSDAPGYC